MNQIQIKLRMKQNRSKELVKIHEIFSFRICTQSTHVVMY